MSHRERQRACGAFCFAAILAGIIFGAIVGVLFASELIPDMSVALFTALGLSGLGFILVFVSAIVSGCAACCALGKCLRRHISCLFAGIFGTLLFSVVLFSIVLNPLSLTVQVLVAIFAFFFAFLVTELIGFISCLIGSGGPAA